MVTTEALTVAPCVSKLHIAVRKAPRTTSRKDFFGSPFQMTQHMVTWVICFARMSHWRDHKLQKGPHLLIDKM